MLKGMTKHEDKEHGKTLKREAPRSINHKVTQNKNNTVLNTKIHKKFGSDNGSLTRSVHHSEDAKSN